MTESLYLDVICTLKPHVEQAILRPFLNMTPLHRGQLAIFSAVFVDSFSSFSNNGIESSFLHGFSGAAFLSAFSAQVLSDLYGTVCFRVFHCPRLDRFQVGASAFTA